MSERIAAIVASTLTLLAEGCCGGKSEDFVVDARLTRADVAEVMGVGPAWEPECMHYCSYEYEQLRNWHIVKVNSCEFEVDTKTTADPAGWVRCDLHIMRRYCKGRRPLGYVSRERGDALPEVLSEFAELEAASVVAFETLADRLRRWGAPPALVARCRAAAADEVRHAQLMHALARAHGATERTAVCVPPRTPTLLEEAIHNATEGCVAETWAALVAHHHAAHARDVELRVAHREIADDETRHGQLAWDLHAWFCSQLDPAGCAVVIRALDEALAGLESAAAAEARDTPPAFGPADPVRFAAAARHFATALYDTARA